MPYSAILDGSLILFVEWDVSLRGVIIMSESGVGALMHSAQPA
jgi:hypothetical protein